MITREPLLTVGILDKVSDVRGDLTGTFTIGNRTIAPGPFHARPSGTHVEVVDASGTRFTAEYELTVVPAAQSTFVLHNVVIGLRFHWERPESQRFEGWLRIVVRKDGSLAVINEVPLEAYLKSVISSEMSATAPAALLEAHAITSRSWLVAMLERARVTGVAASPVPVPDDEEIVRWYTREDHDLFDVCADDHCQRYQGITKIISPTVYEAVEKTRGLFLVSENAVCDARFHKACGGRTEEFRNAWEPRFPSYLTSVCDSGEDHPPITSEEEARRWIEGSPAAFCNTTDLRILRQVLLSFDQETLDFYRWTFRASRQEFEEWIRTKGGVDLGVLRAMVPLERGPSGRISRLRLEGSRRTVTIGKELEIRRWLSPSHLRSSAFIVEPEAGSDDAPAAFTLRGAGWGHGVGLCQIGAAVMAFEGYSAVQIVEHYFRGAELRRLYAEASVGLHTSTG